MSYVDLSFVKKILRDDYLVYPTDITPYEDFAIAEINARLAGVYQIPFDDIALYPDPPGVPPLIQWIAAYLIGYKIYDEMTSLENLDNSKSLEWWTMAENWLIGLAGGTYLLHMADGTVVEVLGSSTAPRSYPSGVRDKAPSADNIPFFNRTQAGEW